MIELFHNDRAGYHALRLHYKGYGFALGFLQFIDDYALQIQLTPYMFHAQFLMVSVYFGVINNEINTNQNRN